jgi:hypothetical protein
MRLNDIAARVRALPGALAARATADYAKAEGLVGYLRNRLLEKGTWVSIGGAVLAANQLKPPFAAASIAVAAVVALLPTP